MTNSDGDIQMTDDVNYFVIPFADDQSNTLSSNLNKMNIRLSYRNIFRLNKYIKTHKETLLYLIKIET